MKPLLANQPVDHPPTPPAPNSSSLRSEVARRWRGPCAVVAIGLAVIAALAGQAQGQALYQARVTDLNRVGMTLTNYGFLGNNFISRTPSLEYPLGLGIEHMSRAGVWVGALVITDQGEQYRVTTGALDNSQASNQVADTEWTPVEGGILERSNLTNSQFFSPDAVSEQDYVCSYRDVPGRGPTGISGEDHVPLGIRIDQEIYSFSIEPASDFVILHLNITNESSLLRDINVGIYTQLVSGDKSLYSSWPPSATGGPGSWYRRHYVDYVDSLRLAREHICSSLPGVSTDPTECALFEQAPYWAGVKLLGVKPGDLSDKNAGFRLWAWDPQDTTRDEDSERFDLLAAGVVDPGHIPNANAPSGVSPIEMVTVGPFPVLAPDSTITVDFAFVFGATQADLEEHANFAQFAFDLDFKLPRPPPSPRLHARPDGNQVTLLWDDSPERASDETSPQPGGIDFQGYRIYLSENRNELNRIGQYDIVDSTGFNTSLDAIRLAEPEIISGDTVRYGYTVTGLRDGFSYFASVTSFDTGDDQVSSLESGVTQNKIQLSPSPNPSSQQRQGVTVFPNPYKVDAIWDAGSLVRDQFIWFANLPRRCKISIFTLSGDLVFEVDFDGDNYVGANARGFYDPNADLDVPPPELSGGAFAWNLITREGQAAVTGLYIYTVSEISTGDIQRGKFLIIKSDREGF